MRITIIISILLLTFNLHGQNLFPVKLNNCKTEKFCLDCGDIKAGYDKIAFNELLTDLNIDLNSKGIKGSVMVQVLVSSKGRTCVLSHSDKSKNPITLKIIKNPLCILTNVNFNIINISMKDKLVYVLNYS